MVVGIREQRADVLDYILSTACFSIARIVSVISSEDEPDYGHPRAQFIGAVGKASRSTTPLVFSTKVASNFIEVGEKDTQAPDAKLENLDTRTPGADSFQETSARYD